MVARPRAPSMPVEPGRVAQVLATGHVAVEADAVGHVADAALDLERAARRVEPDDPGLPGGRLGQAEEHEDRRRLARAVLAEQAEDLAGADLEVEVVDRDEVAVALGQARESGCGCRPAGHLAPAACRRATCRLGAPLGAPAAAPWSVPAAGAGPCRRRCAWSASLGRDAPGALAHRRP